MCNNQVDQWSMKYSTEGIHVLYFRILLTEQCNDLISVFLEVESFLVHLIEQLICIPVHSYFLCLMNIVHGCHIRKHAHHVGVLCKHSSLSDCLIYLGYD